MSERYVVAGLARPREQWFGDVARWATSGVVPVEFVKCLSHDEVTALLVAGRRLSALLVQVDAWPLERELVQLALRNGCATIAVSNGIVHHDWESLGCATVLADDFGPDDLIDALQRHAVPVDREVLHHGSVRLGTADDASGASTISVLGSGGTGTSTIAMFVAQAMAPSGSTLLIDGARRSDHAMYHDIGDVIPGLPELVDAHRTDRLDPMAVRELTFEIPSRGYELLLGLRRPNEWVTLRQPSVGAALDSAANAYDNVVIDVDADLEDESLTGSPDLADRHSLTLCALERSDLVLVVVRDGLHGTMSARRLLDELHDSGVEEDRCQIVVNHAPRNAAQRAALTRTFARLQSPPPLFVPTLRRLSDMHHRVTPLHDRTVRRLRAALRHRVASLPELGPAPDAATPVNPARRPRSAMHTGDAA